MLTSPSSMPLCAYKFTSMEQPAELARVVDFAGVPGFAEITDSDSLVCIRKLPCHLGHLIPILHPLVCQTLVMILRMQRISRLTAINAMRGNVSPCQYSLPQRCNSYTPVRACVYVCKSAPNMIYLVPELFMDQISFAGACVEPEREPALPPHNTKAMLVWEHDRRPTGE